jgi:hypothetical protein
MNLFYDRASFLVNIVSNTGSTNFRVPRPEKKEPGASFFEDSQPSRIREHRKCSLLLLRKNDPAGWLHHDMTPRRAKTIQRGIMMSHDEFGRKHLSVNR